MNPVSVAHQQAQASANIAQRWQQLAPKPVSIADTGLSENMLKELVAKHLYVAGVLNVAELCNRVALPGPVLNKVVEPLRAEGYLEVRSPPPDTQLLRYALTERGRNFAKDAVNRDGYVGPAPVTVNDYNRVVEAQSVHQAKITRGRMRAAFADTVVAPELLDQLGPALHSGRALLIYGQAGSGKSYLARRLARLLGEPILVPAAIAVDEIAVAIWDPVVHREVGQTDDSPFLDHGFDRRYRPARRPAVMSGGELTMGMLEVVYEPATHIHEAPLQVKANNGIYVVDDLGRQRVDTVELLNRWIVPMEYGRDYYHLVTGARFPMQFDVVLIFSTNLRPMDIGDEAFLRRMGHKIRFEALRPELYRRIWEQVGEEYGLELDDALVEYAIDKLHAKYGIPLLACYPRDLLRSIADARSYGEEHGPIETTDLERAWVQYQVLADFPGNNSVASDRG